MIDDIDEWQEISWNGAKYITVDVPGLSDAIPWTRSLETRHDLFFLLGKFEVIQFERGYDGIYYSIFIKKNVAR